MFIFLMVIQGLIALSLIFIIMLQKSDGSGLSGLGGAGSPSGFMSARGTANLLTRATGVLAALFMGGCLLLAAIVGRSHDSQSIIKELEATSTLYQSDTRSQDEGTNSIDARGENEQNSPPPPTS